MDLATLRGLTRVGLDDTVVPYLHSDATVNGALNNAVREVCLRTRCLQDDTTTAVCRITLIDEQAEYALHDAIAVVRAAHVTGRKPPLWLTTAAELDKEHPGWSHNDDIVSGCPNAAIFDANRKKIRLYPPPAVGDDPVTLYLRVCRLPREGELMVNDGDEPIVSLPDPEELKHWAIYECLLNPDGEAGDIKKAADHLALFEQRFGVRPSAHQLQLWSTARRSGPRRMQRDF